MISVECIVIFAVGYSEPQNQAHDLEVMNFGTVNGCLFQPFMFNGVPNFPKVLGRKISSLFVHNLFKMRRLLSTYRQTHNLRKSRP